MGIDQHKTQLQRQKITVVGTGQVACVIIALLVKRNRDLVARKKLDDSVEISVLGHNENSQSYNSLKQSGININFKNPADINLDDLKIHPSEISIITTDPFLIGPQDHVFVATKFYSYTPELFRSLNSALKKPSPPKGYETTIIPGHNGITFWFLQGTKWKNHSLRSVDPDNEILKAIGIESVVGCTLDFGCNAHFNEDGSIVYDMYTALANIAIPMGRPDKKQTEGVRNLGRIFHEAGIRIAVRQGGITENLWLKIQINIAINALTTLLDCDVSSLLSNPKTTKVIKKLSSEVDSIAREALIGELRDEERLISRLNSSGHHITSMRADFNSGKPVEISIYGSILEFVGLLDTNQVLDSTIANITEILKSAVISRDEAMKRGIPLEESLELARSSVAEQLSIVVDEVDRCYQPRTPTRSPQPRPDHYTDIEGFQLAETSNKKPKKLSSSDEITGHNP